MKASAEISLYPLDVHYKERIIAFIKRLRKSTHLTVMTNGMSTQIFGEYDELMKLLTQELKPELEQHRCMAVLKIGDGLMLPGDIPEEIK